MNHSHGITRSQRNVSLIQTGLERGDLRVRSWVCDVQHLPTPGGILADLGNAILKNLEDAISRDIPDGEGTIWGPRGQDVRLDVQPLVSGRDSPNPDIAVVIDDEVVRNPQPPDREAVLVIPGVQEKFVPQFIF
ncbi:MAG: hypothetical protein HYW10_02970 [Candidatus Omnitrophica bacterium]|nr:hypothetical protein [Candidatus Omnitrophota bacterium]